MSFVRSRFFSRSAWWRNVSVLILSLVMTIASLTLGNPALAGLTDDRYDGEIFALYAGNGSLVPPKIKLKDSFNLHKPVLLVFYNDDSSDCKAFSAVVSQLQAFYGRAADFMPIRVDSLPVKETFDPTEPGYYYKGYVPQTVVFDQSGKVVFDGKGNVAYENVDDVFRTVFDLLPRSQSTALKRRSVNEVNTELVPPTAQK
ncbi:MAG: thylakoid membrane photosystem I accumulation factor [Candidatus Parcubacteria bacterium]|uniref:thylakoid membrane photosystem I accumulation factor n=1 Tax=Phormidesmis priestleyi TaxID=268141 RepID=UPI00083AAC15|nr:thylakoid membrane photosystem I accumulation factor [Phormidesmis priestleyi]MBC7825590.1 thylakoid membrane photosystem I accumulation factor [Leptolyngbyaceae cyanobacterium LF-bin-113]